MKELGKDAKKNMVKKLLIRLNVYILINNRCLLHKPIHLKEIIRSIMPHIL